MSTEFLRLRRKNTLWRTLRALLTGIAVALLLAGGLMALFKLTSTDGRMMLCLAVGGGAGLLAAVIRWILLRRSDIRAAEQIDAEHGLRERVQTMIAFQKEESTMLQLQREDTEERLRSVKRYGVRTGSVIVHVGVVVLAAAVLVGGMILPAKAEVEPPVYVEPDYNASEWQKASLEALILHVQESNMAQPAKDQTIGELEALRDALDTSISVSAFKAQVITAISNVYTYTDRINSNDDLHDVVISVEHDLAELLAYVVGSLANAQLNADVEDIGYHLGKEDMRPTIGDLATQLNTQLDRIPAYYVPENSYDETDVLYCATRTLATGLQDVAEMLEAGQDTTAVQNRLGEVIHTFKSQINLGLEQQTVTKEECVYVVNSLCGIFGLSASECPRDPDPTYSKKTDNDDYDPSGGGAGTGEMQFAGDEQVFDYKQNIHVSYTDLIREYYVAMLQASQEGKISEEMTEYILKYFSNLYTG